MARISVASAKAKGRKLQQTVRDAILTAFPSLQPDDVRSCAMGSQGEDIQLSPTARALFPYSVECKARKSIGLVYDALDQARTQNTHTPLAVVKADRKKPLVVIELDAFMALLAAKPD